MILWVLLLAWPAIGAMVAVLFGTISTTEAVNRKRVTR